MIPTERRPTRQRNVDLQPRNRPTNEKLAADNTRSRRPNSPSPLSESKLRGSTCHVIRDKWIGAAGVGDAGVYALLLRFMQTRRPDTGTIADCQSVDSATQNSLPEIRALSVLAPAREREFGKEALVLRLRPDRHAYPFGHSVRFHWSDNHALAL